MPFPMVLAACALLLTVAACGGSNAGRPAPPSGSSSTTNSEVPKVYFRAFICSNLVVKHQTEQAARATLAAMERFAPAARQAILRIQNLTERYCGARANFYMKWIDVDAEPYMLKYLSTSVHESSHVFTAAAPYENRRLDEAKSRREGEPHFLWHSTEFAFYFFDGTSYIVPVTETFPAREIVPYFADPLLRTNRFRHYVDTHQRFLGTQFHGVYGLLDEWHAYMHGTATELNLNLKLTEEQRKIPVKVARYSDAFEMLGDSDSCYAYLEFKLFILRYLHHAQVQYPDVFKSVMANREFLATFQKVDEAFGRIYQDYRRALHDFSPNKNGNDQTRRMEQELATPELLAIMERIKNQISGQGTRNEVPIARTMRIAHVLRWSGR